MSTANSDSFNVFPYLDSLYTFFSSLIAIPGISKTMLNKKNGESEHLCLSSDLRNNAFTFSLLSMMLAVGLSYMVFIKLRYGPFVPTFWRGFFFFKYHKWVLNFVKRHYCICWDDHMDFILQFVDRLYHIDLQMLKSQCISGMNPTWLWYMIFLMYCWIWIASILLRIFPSIFISNIHI